MDSVTKRDRRAAVWFFVGIAILGWAILAHVDGDLQLAGIALCVSAIIARALYLVMTLPCDDELHRQERSC